jgi:hypothetical protein
MQDAGCRILHPASVGFEASLYFAMTVVWAATRPSDFAITFGKTPIIIDQCSRPLWNWGLTQANRENQTTYSKKSFQTGP